MSFLCPENRIFHFTAEHTKSRKAITPSPLTPHPLLLTPHYVCPAPPVIFVVNIHIEEKVYHYLVGKGRSFILLSYNRVGGQGKDDQ